ncbi:MAG TPA: hypothetical protein VFB65_24355 [Pyrinomonadaceae bacterium]|nr:hypothetical protein [Pyrinomonadaceae bacterium]
MRHAVNLLVIVLLSCVFASAQTAADVQNFSRGGVSFDYPKGWTLQEVPNDDALNLVLSRPNNDMQIKIFVHTGRITPEKLPGAKKAFIDPYITANVKQFEQMSAMPKMSPDTSEIGGVKAEGVNITASLGGETGASKIYWALLGQRVVVLTLFGPDRDIKKFSAVWDLVRTTLKIEEPKPAASPSPKP